MSVETSGIAPHTMWILPKKGAQSAFHIAVIKEMESLLAQLHLLHTAAWPSL